MKKKIVTSSTISFLFTDRKGKLIPMSKNGGLKCDLAALEWNCFISAFVPFSDFVWRIFISFLASDAKVSFVECIHAFERENAFRRSKEALVVEKTRQKHFFASPLHTECHRPQSIFIRRLIWVMISQAGRFLVCKSIYVCECKKTYTLTRAIFGGRLCVLGSKNSRPTSLPFDNRSIFVRISA